MKVIAHSSLSQELSLASAPGGLLFYSYFGGEEEVTSCWRWNPVLYASLGNTLPLSYTLTSCHISRLISLVIFAGSLTFLVSRPCLDLP